MGGALEGGGVGGGGGGGGGGVGRWPVAVRLSGPALHICSSI